MKKVLVLSYVFPPFFSVGGSIRVVKFIKYMIELGWTPSILTIDDSKEYDTQRKEGSNSLLSDIPNEAKIFRTISGEVSLESLEKGRNIRDKYPLAGKILSFLSSLRSMVNRYVLIPDENVTWLPFAVKLGRKIIEEENVNLLFVTCPPHSAALVGMILKWMSRRKLIFGFRDDWVGTSIHNSKPKICQLFEKCLEKMVIRAADKVILVTEESRLSLIERYPHFSHDKFCLIPNGCDIREFSETDSLPTNAFSSKFLIFHAGLLTSMKETLRTPESFFLALSEIRNSYPSIASEIVTVFAGQVPHKYCELAAKLGLLDSIKEVGNLSHQEAIQHMKKANLLLAIATDGFPNSIPGKLYEYWAAGNAPILLIGHQGAAQKLIEKNKLGVTVSPENIDDIRSFILKAFRQHRSGQPLRIQTKGLEEFDRRTLATKLVKTFESVLFR